MNDVLKLNKLRRELNRKFAKERLDNKVDKCKCMLCANSLSLIDLGADIRTKSK